MTLLIILSVLLLAYVSWFIYRRRFAKISQLFVMMCSDYVSIVDTSQVLEEKPLSTLGYKSMDTKCFSAQYDPQDPKLFFEQMELVYQYVSDYYNQIKHYEMSFRDDEWKSIHLYHNAVEHVHFQMRLAKWHNFGLE